MHDPDVVAFEIKRPWPAKSSFRGHWWPSLITVWHTEPGGRDAFEVCKHSSYWKWHVHHWRVQITPVQRLRRFLFERCTECGRRYPWGYAPVSHQWDEPGARWWHVTRSAYHHECSGLVHLRRTLAQTEDVVRRLAAEVRVRADESEIDLLERLDWRDHFLRWRLERVLGYGRDDNHQLVKTTGQEGD